MKTIFFTQRQEYIKDYKEKRDCIDQNIPKLVSTLGFLPVGVPNNIDITSLLFSELTPSGVLLTGGNSLAKYGGDAPERDLVECYLIDKCIENDIPLFGICRGFQIIADYFGCSLRQIMNHVKNRHSIDGSISRYSVNSFHNFTICEPIDDFLPLGIAPDGSIEAFRHKEFRIMAIAWHPERESPFHDADIDLMKKFFET